MEQEGIELSVLNSGKRFTEIDAAIEQVAQAIPGANKTLIGLLKKSLDLKLGEDVFHKCLAAMEEHFTDSEINEFYSSKNDQGFLMVNILKILPCFKTFERLDGLAKKHAFSSKLRQFFDKTPAEHKREVTRQFCLVAEKGDTDPIVAFIQSQSPALMKKIIQDVDFDVLKLLLRGISESKVACVKVAVEVCGADVNAVISNGMRPLHLAIVRPDVAVIECLLKAGANVNYADELYGATALHIVIVEGAVECAKLLLEHGANPNAIDKKGYMPIDLLHDQTSPMFNLLIKAGAKWPTNHHLAFMAMSMMMLRRAVPEEGDDVHAETLLRAMQRPMPTREELPVELPAELLESFQRVFDVFQDAVKGCGKK